MHMSKKEVLRRMDLGDVDLILEQYAKGKSIMLMSAHYGNWERATAFALKLPEDMQIYNVYKRLNNKKFDNFMLEIRSKFNAQSVEIHNLLRTMVNLRKEGKISVFGMISDQSPWVRNINHWNTFLNQDTPVITGTEQLAKKFDYRVFYIHIHRVKRGYYKFEYIPVSLEPTLTSEFEISNKYMEILEQKIKAVLEYWLWTHNRWKHSHLRKK